MSNRLIAIMTINAHKILIGSVVPNTATDKEQRLRSFGLNSALPYPSFTFINIRIGVQQKAVQSARELQVGPQDLAPARERN